MTARASTATRHERDLREMADAKWTQRRMAAVLGVSESTVNVALKTLRIPHVGNSWSRRRFTVLPIVTMLREERMSQGLSSAALGRRAGYHRGQISEWERGARGCPPHALHNIAQALGCEITLKRMGV